VCGKIIVFCFVIRALSPWVGGDEISSTMREVIFVSNYLTTGGV
jgi:hypothetical protein